MSVKILYIKDKKINFQKELQVGASLILGREGDLDVIKQEAGISREHAKVIVLENFLLLKDLESTNGSWLDEKKAVPNEWTAAQYPCLLQIANAFLGFEQDTDYISKEIFGALAVFKKGEFINDFPLKKIGKSLVIGGLGASLDFDNEGFRSDRPALVIERRAKDLVAYGISRMIPFSVNGENIDGRVSLKNLDKIEIENYIMYVVFFDKEIKRKKESNEKENNNSTGSILSLKAWEDDDFDATDVFHNKSFRQKDSVEKTDPLLMEDFRKFEDEKIKINYEIFEDKIFFYLSLFCIVIMIGLLIAFIF